ncbi:unnamed protein product [Cylicocyclus nassatus]|uniref:Spermidine synthase n=1 Tax=Cylicocyclus nassatus TaxID=53992 RepID=A0AA36M6K1_CYLNA|nr:unnamed protein product [Cylicocyclus nassatus]
MKSCNVRSWYCIAFLAVMSAHKRPPCAPVYVAAPTRPPCAQGYMAPTRRPCLPVYVTAPTRKPRPPTPQWSFAKLFENYYGSKRVIDGPFRLMDGTMVEVADTPVYWSENSTYLMRELVTDQVIITSMNLKFPPSLDVRYIDSRSWEPDHDSLDFTSYTTTMIEQMFVYGAVEISSNARADVLSIGLGTGYINSYLHKNYPRMNITVVEIDPVMLEISKKWFGLVLDNRQRVLIEDGVQFVRRMAAEKRGKVYDVIHLDACTMDESAQVNCPIDIFMTPEIARDFAELLGTTGILVINVMTLKADHIAAAKLVKRAFQKFFYKCDGKYAPFAPPNIVMTCAKTHKPVGLKERYQEWKGYRTGD